MFDLQPLHSKRTLRLEVRLRPQDGEPIVRHLYEVHSHAWIGKEPLDFLLGERRPRWVDAKL